MADNFIGEIRAFAFSFAPADWAFCNGAALPKTQYQALFAVIGSIFSPTAPNPTTFNIPNLQSQVPLGTGPGTVLGLYQGAESVSLTASDLPPHTHNVNGSFQNDSLGTGTPSANTQISYAATVQAGTPIDIFNYASNPTPNTNMADQSVTSACGADTTTTPHENRQPYLALNFCISLLGEWPMRP